LWEGGNVSSECGVVDLVNEDAEEGSSVGVRIGLQLSVDLDDEGGSDRGEQTGLMTESTRVRRKDQGGVQILAILFEKFLVVLLGHLVIAFVESSLGIFSR
jgi:hypothetical protein